MPEFDPGSVHMPQFNRRARRLLAKELGSSSFTLQSWQTIHRTTVDKDGAEHQSHSHTFSLSTDEQRKHHHSGNYFESVDCGYGRGRHDHWGLSHDDGAHTHTVSGTTSVESATNLNHTHTISTTTTEDGRHRHSLGMCSYEKCAGCPSKHMHHGSWGAYAYAAAHNHSLSGSTSTGVGTLGNHTHTISLTTGTNPSHTHAPGTAHCPSDDCYKGYEHSHDALTTDDRGGHTHLVVGDTDPSGEGFAPGSSHTAVATMLNPTVVGFDYLAELYMGADLALMSSASFRLEAKESKNISFPVTMPNTPGAYSVHIGVFSRGKSIGLFKAPEDVVIVGFA